MPRVDERQNLITSEEQETAIVRGMSNNSGPLVLIAYSLVNAFEGEPVALMVRWFQNPIVFAENEVIAEARIDGRQSLPEIVSQISTFLTGSVREKARTAGMIPSTGAEASFGSVSSADVLQIVDQVRNTGRIVRVQVLAHSVTRAGDSLNLEFRIR
jgi:hypothetical protein